MSSNENQPMYVPAAICSLAAYIPGIIYLFTSNTTSLVATGIIWGAGVALWAENGRKGGTVPWPRSWNEYEQMTKSLKR